MYCLRCSRHTKWLKTDKTKKIEDEIVRVWKCGTCGGEQRGYVYTKRQQPKELYFDVETSFLTVAVPQLRIRGGYISSSSIIRPMFIICWTAGWIGESKIYSACVTPNQAKHDDDSKILKPLWDLMNDADIVIGHNSNNFDIKTFNYRLWLNNLKPPERYMKLDTLKEAKKHFRAESNKMDYLSSRIDGKRKYKMETQDWIDCAAGNPKALNKMMKYNRGDVREGKELYEKMLDWIPTLNGQSLRQGIVR